MTWYLRSGGKANTAAGDGWLSLAPPEHESADVYCYDPADPVPTIGGATLMRGMDDGSDYGKGIALTHAALGLIGGGAANVVSRAQGMEAVGGIIQLVVGLLGLALFITFWVKVANYSNQLAASGPARFDRGFDDYGGPRDIRRDEGGPPDSYRADDKW